jgi:hypothetical protein
MTAVGKILVIINLLCSLAVGYLVTVVYVTRTHWVDEFNKLKGRYEIAQASEQTYKTDAEKAFKDADGRVAQAQAQVKKLEADQKSLMDINANLHAENVAQNKKATKGDANVNASQMEILKRQAESEKLRETLKQADAAALKLVQERSAMQDRAVAAEIQMKAAVDRAQRLEGQMQELTKELVRMRSSGGAGGVARAGGPNPPPDNVEGLIKNTDPSTNLVTITIGSDAGLSRGHTLEVFRLSPIPQQSKYLGRIRILEVTATQAVGQPVGKMSTPPQPGDRVASHILGG